MPRRYIEPPPNLRHFVESGHVVSTYCNACLTAGRNLEPTELAERLGWEATKPDIEARLRCTRCGERRGTIQVGTRNYPSPTHGTCPMQRVSGRARKLRYEGEESPARGRAFPLVSMRRDDASTLA